MGTRQETLNEQKRCFIVMGFGIKTDFATGRKLDLNKSYRLLIKPVVEAKGLICIRADEIRHSGSIDVPMYQELLKADVVIADISTANLNAFYELGIRHAMRPRTTIVISEDQLSYPFDLNHVMITKYTHLGESIDYDEVERFRKVLDETLEAVLKNEGPDSPVYTYLHDLVPPSLRKQTAKAVKQIEIALKEGSENENTGGLDSKVNGEENKTLALLTEQGEQALRNKRYLEAKTLFSSARLIGKRDDDESLINNSYLIHRLALSTYKSKEPDEITALKDAILLLNQLDLDHTNDPETVSLAAAIEKRLYENGQGDEHIQDAILFYQRGYFLLHSRYNGINLAFMLNCRADSSLSKTNEDRIADIVWANRIRMEILDMCERDWDKIINKKDRAAKKAIMMEDDDLSNNQIECESKLKFWILANKAESHFALGEMKEYEVAFALLKTIEHQEWMIDSVTQQIENLNKILIRTGHLQNPPWPAEVLQEVHA